MLQQIQHLTLVAAKGEIKINHEYNPLRSVILGEQQITSISRDQQHV